MLVSFCIKYYRLKKDHDVLPLLMIMRYCATKSSRETQLSSLQILICMFMTEFWIIGNCTYCSECKSINSNYFFAKHDGYSRNWLVAVVKLR